MMQGSYLLLQVLLVRGFVYSNLITFRDFLFYVGSDNMDIDIENPLLHNEGRHFDPIGDLYGNYADHPEDFDFPDDPEILLDDSNEDDSIVHYSSLTESDESFDKDDSYSVSSFSTSSSEDDGFDVYDAALNAKPMRSKRVISLSYFMFLYIKLQIHMIQVMKKKKRWKRRIILIW